MSETINVLFVCSMNQWRSPTAEKIYSKEPFINVRSAGTSSKARRHVSLADLKWADVVIVMESKHKQRLTADYRQTMRDREVHVLEIEDRYKFRSPSLSEPPIGVLSPLMTFISPLGHNIWDFLLRQIQFALLEYLFAQ